MDRKWKTCEGHTGRNDFYPNMTTLRSGICRRKSVCRLSWYCNVRAPIQPVELLRNVSTSFIPYPFADLREKFY